MSALIDQLEARVVDTESCHPDAGSQRDITNLAELRRDCLGRITGFSESMDQRLVRRFFDLGFVPGASVRVVRRAPLGDPAVYRVCDYEIAVRREHARLIRVEPQR